MTSNLFGPLQLGPLELRNRIVVSPMCQYSATDGSASEWHRTHWGTLAGSGAALVMVEATAVSAEGRITHADLGLYSDANEAAIARVLDGVRCFSDTPFGIQLGHAGRKASSEVPWQGGQLLAPQTPHGWLRLAPSACALAADEAPPAAMGRAELKRVRQAFVTSTQRAMRLGFATVQLHFAHGYLMHQFLSPVANGRTDEYGGPLENRLRYPLEVLDAVRQACPDTPLGMRVSATDWMDGGWDLEQTVQLAQRAKALGLDWIDVSSGGISPQQKIKAGLGYQVPFARAIRQASGLPTSAVGLIVDAQQAEDILRQGDADLVSLARAMLWNPHWPWQAAAELGAQVKAPPQYWRSAPKGAHGVFAGHRDGARGSAVK